MKISRFSISSLAHVFGEQSKKEAERKDHKNHNGCYGRFIPFDEIPFSLLKHSVCCCGDMHVCVLFLSMYVKIFTIKLKILS